MSAPLIELSSIGLSRGPRAILGDVSMSVAVGDRVAILGPSGTGKSTLLQIIAGLLAPSRGQVRIAGAPVKGPTPSVTMMLQRPALLPWASALDNVLLGLRFQQGSRLGVAAMESTARDLLVAVGLGGRANARPAELSGGEQQRVALARSLAPSPSVLLLDEPFSALDPVTRAALRQDVAALVAARRVTLLLVTHDAADAAALCRRTISLAGAPARIVEDTHPKSLWHPGLRALAAA